MGQQRACWLTHPHPSMRHSLGKVRAWFPFICFHRVVSSASLHLAVLDINPMLPASSACTQLGCLFWQVHRATQAAGLDGSDQRFAHGNSGAANKGSQQQQGQTNVKRQATGQGLHNLTHFLCFVLIRMSQGMAQTRRDGGSGGVCC